MHFWIDLIKQCTYQVEFFYFLHIWTVMVQNVFSLSRLSPTPQNVEWNILEYIDCKIKDIFFTTNLL